MSTDLNDAITSAAREDGVTAAAWVRRMLLDRFAMISPSDERSGRPVRRAAEDVVAISNAIRHLADVSGAVSVGNRSAAQDALQSARHSLSRSSCAGRNDLRGDARAGIGDALARHLLKAENERVVVVPPRGLGSADLVEQLRELVALSAGGRTDRPVYHVHLDPDAGIADEAAARSRWWALFEAEFGLSNQPYCGVEHLKHGRAHEHRVYSLVLPSGGIADLAWDYARREKCSRIVEAGFGMRPVASKHARTVERHLRAEGHVEVADWLERSGATTAPRPIAASTPRERAIQERTGASLDGMRRAVPGSMACFRRWPGLRRRLARPRLRASCRAGRGRHRGWPGTAHLASRVVGAAARRIEGRRILAADVHARARWAGIGGSDGWT